MKFKAKKKTAIIILTLIFVLLASMMIAVTAQAKTKHRYLVSYESGNVYVYKDGKMCKGWVKVGRNTYYLYKQKHTGCPKGSACTNEYRMRGGKFYYFGPDGIMQRKDSRYIDVRKDGSIKYVYMAGMIRRLRYNCDSKHYQWLSDSGHWEDVGMQCIPEGMIDRRK